jgi:hypothetical protein
MIFFTEINKLLVVSGLFFLLCSMDLFSQDLDSLVYDPDETVVNPYFLPVVFDGQFSGDMSIRLPVLEESRDPLSDPFPFQWKKEENFVDQLRRRAYRNLLSQRIDLVKYKLSDFPEKLERMEVIQPTFFENLFSIDYSPSLDDIGELEYRPKRVYWDFNASNLLQFSQNYISDNWYKGGIGNLNLLSVQNCNINYKKDKIQFNNFIEWKLSFFTNPNDTIRDFRIGEDLIRTYSDFGIRAFTDKWSYSTNIEIKTQLLKNYEENTEKLRSSIFSPVMVNMGILGMKYQLKKSYKTNKYKKLDLSTDISPLSVQYTYVNNEEVDPSRFGIEAGKYSLLQLGSTVNAKIVVNFNRQVTFTSRFKFFTDYKKESAESENELNISLNRYFSTRIYCYARFDDTPGIAKEPNLGFWQMNELFSFGFNYKW